ncbi:MAG TPA: hypothetical protein DEF21_11305 [Thalassospira lucentensis]|uniref:Uncharacterized protein n=2 Tax=Thalassospira lucentensis TaxID=168935 RepID=A0A358HTG7_9PROT|nr:hypothetical protein [Thalassospira lucentensis]HCW66369.1 hypothetical protein [Thalassospira lucentensis]|tara:strand:+ start:1845 stop:2150 length:306 start_codon:yes stop_codon:yes gene_type:complete
MGFTTQSHAENQAYDLVKSCVEAVDVFDNKGANKILAAVSTSLEEALRAGYCRGVIIEYRRQERGNCERSSWLVQARNIASHSINDLQKINIDALLRSSCD